MKCHSGKKIKGQGVCMGELQTKRTVPGPNGTVRRERYCPICDTQQWTVEIFEAELQNERNEKESEIATLNRKLIAAKSEVEGIKMLADSFFTLLNIIN